MMRVSNQLQEFVTFLRKFEQDGVEFSPRAVQQTCACIEGWIQPVQAMESCVQAQLDMEAALERQRRHAGSIVRLAHNVILFPIVARPIPVSEVSI